MPSQSNGTVTRKSNGSLEFTPADGGSLGQLPAMGDEVSVTFEVIRTAAQIEKANAASKAARLAPVEESAAVSVPETAAERRAKR